MRQGARDQERSMAARLPGATTRSLGVRYLRTLPPRKDGARLVPSPVGPRKEIARRWIPTWRPSPKLCHLPRKQLEARTGVVS